MSFSMDEVNLLIYRYLLESSFEHAAFAFGMESQIAKSNIDGTLVPAGALLTIIQKGMHYVTAVGSVADNGEVLEITRPFTLLEAVSPDFFTLRQQEARENEKKNSSTDSCPHEKETEEEEEEVVASQEDEDEEESTELVEPEADAKKK